MYQQTLSGTPGRARRAASKGRRRERPRFDEGFSLVEMLVALTLLAVGLLGVGQIFAFSSRSAGMGRMETAAVSLARELEEKALSAEYADVLATFDGVDTDDPGTVTAPCQEWAAHVADQLGPTGRGQVTVFDHTTDADIRNGMLSVEVRMSWITAGDTIFVPIRFGITDVSS